MDSPSPGSDGSNWSKLPPDLLHMVFERLGFADFQRAKSVCPTWHSVSRQSAPNNQIPWLILLPEKGKDYCLLFNPEEKEKVYRIQDLGVEFANSHYLAVYGSWLLMRDARCNLYILNLFTRERIDLPSLESQVGRIKFERTIDDMFITKIVDKNYVGYPEKYVDISHPILWIDEKTKDYVVLWSRYQYLVYSREGDKCWKQVEICSDDMFSIHGMVYKDHKLYLYSRSRDVTILDFSGDIWRKIFETQVNYDELRVKGIPRPIFLHLGVVGYTKITHLVVTVTGEPLRVKSIIRSDSDVWSFRIYKMNSSNSKWKKLTSLGDEAILLDLGITVLANANEGINRNSIYFNGVHDRCDLDWSEKDIFIFNLDTHKVERPHPSICSSIRSSDARWFVPNFKRK
ncbi:putative F-box protein [Cardamine amara subsp. amara]|uniref:F-box protein n=1 Tax=Cardamine amara subsp. amara TaxID=228776 RepID=A0ABD1AJU2_CARAN